MKRVGRFVFTVMITFTHRLIIAIVVIYKDPPSPGCSSSPPLPALSRRHDSLQLNSLYARPQA